MPAPKFRVIVACIGLVIGAINWPATAVRSDSKDPKNLIIVNSASQRYRLDSSQSKFIAHALRGGLLWFKGHDHLVAIREFAGEAQLTPDSISPASLEITAKAASMVETNSVFTDQQKQIIDKELREIVLQPDQYPDITFRSTSVTGKAAGANQYDLKIAGDLTLHGVTRQITIPTKVTVTGNDLRAQGEFSVNRDDFKVKATSAAHGLVRVRNKITFTFDIVGHGL
ncbi:MAG TPA: YceI family protein [Pyrinomonadaceae bacterium]|nr:YceI family protein [Pyrinomonadaceae bacterium]